MELSLRARVRGGDPDAFGMVFEDYGRAVYNLAFRLRGNWQEAEEIVSLTFLEAWRLRARVELDGESLQPWLIGIAINARLRRPPRGTSLKIISRTDRGASCRVIPVRADRHMGNLRGEPLCFLNRMVLGGLERLQPDSADKHGHPFLAGAVGRMRI